MKKAIRVILSNNNITLFIIEGFLKKEVTLDIIKEKILHHFEYMYGKGAIDIQPIGKDFLITTNESVMKISWSWITSYVV